MVAKIIILSFYYFVLKFLYNIIIGSFQIIFVDANIFDCDLFLKKKTASTLCHSNVRDPFFGNNLYFFFCGNVLILFT